MLEAIVRLMARALGDNEVRGGEPVERGLEGGVLDTADGAQQRVGEISAEDGADLRDFARFAKPVEPRRERLLQRRRDRLQAPCFAALDQKAITSSTNSGTPPVRSLTSSTTSLLSA